MEIKELCCTVCPKGCMIVVMGYEKTVSQITGHSCLRGKTYAENEFIAPKRMLTTTVKAEGYVSPVISVRTSQAIDKALLLPCMQVLRNVTVTAPFDIGRVIVNNILGTEADVILTNC